MPLENLPFSASVPDPELIYKKMKEEKQQARQKKEEKQKERQKEKQLRLLSLQLVFQCICDRQESDARHRTDAHNLGGEDKAKKRKNKEMAEEKCQRNSKLSSFSAVRRHNPHLSNTQEQIPAFDKRNSESRSDRELAK